MKKRFPFLKDLSILLSMVWLNLLLFAVLMVGGAVILKVTRSYPQAGWPVLLLDAFHMAITERVVDETDGWVPILLSFLLPIGTVFVLGEGALRVVSIYLQKDKHREEWDMMVVKTFSDHIVVCGVGELGRALVKRLHADHPGRKLVLVDLHAGLLAESGLSGQDVVCLQADMTSMETLEAARCDKARLILLTAGNDAFNLEAAYKIIQLNPQAEIWVRVHSHGLADLMDLARKPNLHFFSPYQQAAEVIAGHLLQGEQNNPS